MSKVNATIIAIGSELLMGQITNRNASWLSSKLTEMQIQVYKHITVDDDGQAIRDALDDAARHSQLIILTGGLGPTSDDITRDIVAHWSGKPLSYDEEAWEKIHKYFAKFHRTPSENNKQQCYFPKDSIRIANLAGTADAFYLQISTGLHVLCLPGPPKEISKLWDDSLYSLLTRTFPQPKVTLVHSIRTIGLGESALAELVEPLLESSALRVTYRAQVPLVEVKLLGDELQKTLLNQKMELISQTLKDHIYERDDEHYFEALAKFLQTRKCTIFDQASRGTLGELLLPKLVELDGDHQNIADISLLSSFEACQDPQIQLESFLQSQTDEHQTTLAITGFDYEGRSFAGLKLAVHTKITTIPPAFAWNDRTRYRNQRAAAYAAVKFWYQELTSILN